MKGDLRCIGGRLFRHDPQSDDPDLEPMSASVLIAPATGVMTQENQ